LLIRVTPAGTPVWTSSLSSGIDAAELHERTGASSWVCGYVIAGELAISDDAVLAVYKDTSSGLAAGYVFSLIDGRLTYTTPVGPISEVAAIGAGRFLIGSQGYGAFATVEYDNEGREARRWNSHGRYILHRGDVRVIELENVVLSLARLVRLQADGSVERGDLLEGYYTSEFWIDSDDTLYFARDGLLIAARDLRIQARQALCDLSWRGAVTHCLAAGRAGLFVTYTAFIDAGRQASGLHYLSGSTGTMSPSDVNRE
jgi:hypothetical protein